MFPNNTAIALKIQIPNPSCCEIKVHRSICIELQGLIHRILNIILLIESSRPNCALAIQALCSLHFTLDKANSLIKYCSESSKLYLIITSHKILTRCEKIKNDFELYLTQIQNTVPIPLAAKICAILKDLRDTKFSLDFEEDEARKVVISMLEKNFSDSNSMENAELEAIKITALRLDIKSPLDLLLEKETLKRQLEKINKRKDKELIEYLLYLLIKYGKFMNEVNDSFNSNVGKL